MKQDIAFFIVLQRFQKDYNSLEFKLPLLEDSLNILS